LAVMKLLWAVVSLVLFALAYPVLFVYEAVEMLWRGFLGFITVLGLLCCAWIRRADANESVVSLYADWVISRSVIATGYAVLSVVPLMALGRDGLLFSLAACGRRI